MASTMVIALFGASLVSSDAYASGATPDYNAYNAGYGLIAPSTAPSEVTAQFKIPAITSCTSKNQQIGVGVLAQASGGDSIFSYVQMGCVHGVAVYQAMFSAYGTVTPVSLTVAAGDTVGLGANMNETNSSLTFGVVGGFSETKDVSNDTAVNGFIGTVPILGGKKDKLLGVPNFGKIAFKDADINLVGIGTYSADLYELIRTNNGDAPPTGTVQVQPGTLKSTSFPLKFQHD